MTSNFLMTPEQHRRRAEQLRQSSPELAKHHEQLAKAIEKRLSDRGGAASRSVA